MSCGGGYWLPLNRDVAVVSRIGIVAAKLI
jgi:hypothetical protein